ncbi:hypothetical protein F2Q69_00028506 [Brassica cretica]|uniref:Replication protein A 70 kDa DNA-binding subunit B/D first OB fold domain-containing protein n=1 Tax=Brassica cretica TaxID=69181 RepID=A0A8S9S7J8_BRACR|nr:hypothetical protein F2Q69_00028506 [Brassica cretica]
MSKMKLAFTPVAQLKPYFENEIWKIKVRVVRMLRFQNGVKPGDVGGIDLILLDDKGDRIQACIRGKLISKFKDDLGEGKCCILMNFKLSHNLGNYRGTPHPFKIFFTWSTHVKKNCEEIPNDSLRFNCISFDDLLSQKHDEKVFVASTLGIEDCVPQLSSKKLKGDVSLLAEEDGQLSSTKSKLKVGHVTKDDFAKPSSTKQRKAANIIPKKEKN